MYALAQSGRGVQFGTIALNECTYVLHTLGTYYEFKNLHHESPCEVVQVCVHRVNMRVLILHVKMQHFPTF